MTGFGLVVHGNGWSIKNCHIHIAEGKALHVYPPVDGVGVIEGQYITADGLVPRDGYETPCFTGHLSVA